MIIFQVTLKRRKSLVDENLVFKTLEDRKHEIINKGGSINSISSNIWSDLFIDLENKLLFNSLYKYFIRIDMDGNLDNFKNLKYRTIEVLTSFLDTDCSLQPNVCVHKKVIYLT